MNGPARLAVCFAIACGAAAAVHAQATLHPTPSPLVFADAEAWYQRGDPVMYGGNVYYPAGPQVHFNGDEMVRSGFFLGVPLYTRTTIEPYSMVFVPLAGGLMQPYERRREGELAGTAGSSAPSFPVASPSEPARVAVPLFAQAPGPPMLGTAGTTYPYSVAAPAATESEAAAASIGAASVAPRPLRRRPGSPNGIFVEFEHAKWFSSGPPRILDTARLSRVGTLGGFPVYSADRGGTTIYIPVAPGADLFAQYSRRGK